MLKRCRYFLSEKSFHLWKQSRLIVVAELVNWLCNTKLETENQFSLKTFSKLQNVDAYGPRYKQLSE